MSQGRRHYGQPQGSLQLFEADSFFEDESRIMQPISNLVEKVKHNKCSYQNCIIGGGHKWPILEAFSAQVWVTSEHPQRYLTLNIPKYRKSRCDDDFISWKLSLNDKMTPCKLRTVTVRYPVWDVSMSLTISATFRFAGTIWCPPIWVRVTCFGWPPRTVELVKVHFRLSAASSNNFYQTQGQGVKSLYRDNPNL